MSYFKPYTTFLKLNAAGIVLAVPFAIYRGDTTLDFFANLIAIFIVLGLPMSLLATRLLSWRTGNGFWFAWLRQPRRLHRQPANKQKKSIYKNDVPRNPMTMAPIGSDKDSQDGWIL